MDPVIAATIRGGAGVRAELMSVGADSQGNTLLDVDGLEIAVDRGELLRAMGLEHTADGWAEDGPRHREAA